MRSIRARLATATDTIAVARISSYSRSRSARVSRLESSSPSG